MSHAPCTFGSPRSALTPLPGLPTLPSKSCRMVNARIPCTPVVCWVIPSAYRMAPGRLDRKSTRLNSSHGYISYAVFCLKKKKNPPSSPVPLTHGPVAGLSMTIHHLTPIRSCVQMSCNVRNKHAARGHHYCTDYWTRLPP